MKNKGVIRVLSTFMIVSGIAMMKKGIRMISESKEEGVENVKN